MKVATPVVAKVVQYDDSWTFLQNGGLTKSPTEGSSTSLATQKEIKPDVTVTIMRKSRKLNAGVTH